MSNTKLKTPITTSVNDDNDSKTKGLLTLVDNTNLKIIEELITNPSTSSSSLAARHGWPETWYEWHKVMSALAKNYTVIAPDLRGLGDL